jgi:ABC-type uncharacterized transport system ATPase component
MDIDTARKMAAISGDPLEDLAAFMVRTVNAEAERDEARQEADKADNKRYELGMECERLQDQIAKLQAGNEQLLQLVEHHELIATADESTRLLFLNAARRARGRDASA